MRADRLTAFFEPVFGARVALKKSPSCLLQSRIGLQIREDGPEEDDREEQSDGGSPAPQRSRGRSCVVIDDNKLQSLLKIGFPVEQIGQKGMLGFKVHPNTIFKHLKARNQQTRNKFTKMEGGGVERTRTRAIRGTPE